MGQGQLAGRFPSEADRRRPPIEGLQPRDDRGPVGFGDGGLRQKLVRDDLMVVRILPLDGSGNQRMRTGPELDVGIVSFFRLQDGGIAGGEVRIWI